MRWQRVNLVHSLNGRFVVVQAASQTLPSGPRLPKCRIDVSLAHGNRLCGGSHLRRVGNHLSPRFPTKILTIGLKMRLLNACAIALCSATLLLSTSAQALPRATHAYGLNGTYADELGGPPLVPQRGFRGRSGLGSKQHR